MQEDSLDLKAAFKGEKHDHLWGYELWLENNSKYCSKLLVLHSGFESSWHYHERKDETFVVIDGKVELTYSDNRHASKVILLDKSDKFRLKPGVIHSFKSLAPRSVVLEISTTDDLDNVKLRPARKL